MGRNGSAGFFVIAMLWLSGRASGRARPRLGHIMCVTDFPSRNRPRRNNLHLTITPLSFFVSLLPIGSLQVDDECPANHVQTFFACCAYCTGQGGPLSVSQCPHVFPSLYVHTSEYVAIFFSHHCHDAIMYIYKNFL